MIKLIPGKNKHYKNIENGDIYEGTIYLSVYDSVDNYVEVAEEEYQQYLKARKEEYLEHSQQTN